jgi:hypothetical protein
MVRSALLPWLGVGWTISLSIAIPTLAPVDQAPSDAVLSRTRAELISAVRERHAEAVLRLISPDVVVQSTAGDGRGWTQIANALSPVRKPGPDDPEDEYWKGLESALALGGAFTTTRGAVLGRQEFCAPYVYATMPDAATMPESVRGEVPPWALIKKNVEVRAAPSSRAKLLMRLSYALLQAPGADHRDPETGKTWQSVELPDGTEAYVPAEAIWDPARYYVCFAKDQNRWLVSAFGRNGPV